MSKRVVLIDPFDSGHHIDYMCCLVSGLLANGWSVSLIGSRHLISSVECNHSISNSIVLSLSDSKNNKHISEVAKVRFLWKALKASRKLNASVVHFVTLDRMILSLAAAMLVVQRDFVLVATLHWPIPYALRAMGVRLGLKNWLLVRSLHLLLKNDIRVLFHSLALSEVANILHDSKRVAYTPYPINSSDFSPRPPRMTTRKRFAIPKSATVVLCFGGLRKEKGSLRAVEILSQLPGNFYLLIAGKEETVSGIDLMNLAAVLGVDDRVKLDLRFIPDDEINDVFSESDVLLLPYDESFAGQSGPLGIAVRHRVPVVSSKAIVLKETVNRYSIGLVSFSGQLQEYASHIQSLDTELATDIARRFMQEHSVSRFVGEIESVYRENTSFD